MDTYRITVLEYTEGKVYSYPISPAQGRDKLLVHVDAENYLTELGFNLNDCHYMVHKSPIEIY